MSIASLLAAADADLIDYTPISLGESWLSKKPVYWDFGNASHPSLLILGRSGVGKTHALKQIARALFERGVSVHIIDSHGDIEVEGFDTFSYGYNSPYGINPFAVDPQPDFGGPQATITQFTSMLRQLHRHLGEKQVATMEHFCQALYAQFGIKMRDPSTWTRKAFTLDDMRQYIENLLVAYHTGIETSAVELMCKLATKIRKLRNKLEAGEGLTAEETDKYETELAEAVAKWRDMALRCSAEEYMSLIERIRSGFNPAGAQSLLILLNRMANTGVFTGKEPSPSVPATRHLVRGFEHADQVMLCETLLSRIFSYHIRNATKLNIPVHTYIIIDEIKLMTGGAFRNQRHVLNRLQTEARKYGVSLILAGQSTSHMPKDMLLNFGTTLLLPVHAEETASIKRVYGIHEATWDRIQPKRDGIVCVDGNKPETITLWT